MNAPFPHQTEPPKPEVSELLGPLRARRVVKKAVILAAGRGRRMGKLTKDRPKAALEVGGHALIDWQIAALQAAGVEDIAVVTGHGAAALAGRGVTYIHNPDWDKGTQVATLLCARDWIGDEPVIVSYGDIIYHPCAPLALLERPGDIIIAYDADHRWLWKRRFGNWLKDSETFRLGPGQVLTEIGGKPTDIEEMDGQFMGLMLLTAGGLEKLTRHHQSLAGAGGQLPDFTRLLSAAITAGERIDTAANLAPWMEVDNARDLRIARKKAAGDDVFARPPLLRFPDDRGAAGLDHGGEDEPDQTFDEGVGLDSVSLSAPPLNAADRGDGNSHSYTEILKHHVTGAFAVQNWGRSGSTFVQSLFDDHPQVLSTPNFYSRRFFTIWARSVSRAPDSQKIDILLQRLRQWWDSALVDATAGLHRLGESGSEVAGVKRDHLEGYLRAAFSDGRPFTRRNLFEAAHLAYALARGQQLASFGLQILFPIHGEPRAVACAFLEDFPDGRFIHTVRDPVANFASSLQHVCFNNLDLRNDALELTLRSRFGRSSGGRWTPFTTFADRAYLDHLRQRDQARLVRLEDLHGRGDVLLPEILAWLGLLTAPSIFRSTWDGKIWWNRPESGSGSPLGGQAPKGYLESRLNAEDRQKVWLLSRGVPLIRASYVDREHSSLRVTLADFATLLMPWRQEGLVRRSSYRSAQALLALSPILPRAFKQGVRKIAVREALRCQLLEMSAGAKEVRKQLTDARKPHTIHALLLLRRVGERWRASALSKTLPNDANEADQLTIAFMEETGPITRLADAAIWLIVLGFGWPLARLHSAMRVRLTCIGVLLTRQYACARRLRMFDPPHPPIKTRNE